MNTERKALLKSKIIEDLNCHPDDDTQTRVSCRSKVGESLVRQIHVMDASLPLIFQQQLGDDEMEFVVGMSLHEAKTLVEALVESMPEADLANIQQAYPAMFVEGRKVA